MADAPCFVCDKHRQGDAVIGGVVHQDDLVYCGHGFRPGRDTNYLGYLIVEPKRHVGGLGDLTPDEAAAVGRLVTAAARALTESEGAEHVHSFVFGDGGVAHLHVHVVPRYPGTPDEFRNVRLTEWPDAPRGGEPEIRAVCDRVRQALRTRAW